MLINTNGFEIGDEVWWWEIDYLDGNKYTYRNSLVYSIIYTHHGIFINMDDKYDTKVHINMCCRSEREVDDICNFMSGKEQKYANR